MNRIHLVGMAMLTALGCTGSAPPKADPEIDGATVYANQCNRCHEFRSPTEFTGPQWSIITTHMRVIGGIPADESRAVYEYLKSQHHPPFVRKVTREDSSSSLEVDPARGRELVRERGCIGCHVVEGVGGTMGPPLDGVARRREEAFVLQQLRDPRANDPASLMPDLGLSDSEVTAIWAYLSTLDTRSVSEEVR